jgi:hypothetical protein
MPPLDRAVRRQPALAAGIALDRALARPRAIGRQHRHVLHPAAAEHAFDEPVRAFGNHSAEQPKRGIILADRSDPHGEAQRAAPQHRSELVAIGLLGHGKAAERPIRPWHLRQRPSLLDRYGGQVPPGLVLRYDRTTSAGRARLEPAGVEEAPVGRGLRGGFAQRGRQARLDAHPHPARHVPLTALSLAQDR